jgi:hypothetical protein
MTASLRVDGTKELITLADGYPGIERELGRLAARRETAWHARPGARGR